MKTQIQKLMVKEMGRKDFLKYSGSVLLTVIGIAGLSRALFQSEHFKINAPSGVGYGSQTYGGKPKSSF